MNTIQVQVPFKAPSKGILSLNAFFEYYSKYLAHQQAEINSYEVDFGEGIEAKKLLSLMNSRDKDVKTTRKVLQKKSV